MSQGVGVTFALLGAVSDVGSQIVNELVKKELLPLNVDYALFKVQKVYFFYPILGHHSHTF